MPLPVVLALTYLAVNLALTIWIIREETQGRPPPAGLHTVSWVTRYVPPLLGLVYLVTLGGDWPFFLFVVFFFGLAFYLLDGLLNYPGRPEK